MLIQHLKLVESIPVDSAILSDLGKVNVICGRNNSGKSAVLSVIANRESVSLGRESQSLDPNRIALDILPSTGWRGDPAMASENKFVAQFVSEVLVTRKVWFAKESSEFANAFHALFKQNYHLQRWDLSLQGVIAAFANQYPKFEPSVLLPPKRSLELSKAIALGDRVQPDGAGLLNFLFFAHNQPLSHEARKQHDAIRAAFEMISDGYSFQAFPSTDNRLQLHFSHRGGTWISASGCGMGLQDLLVMVYFAVTPDVSLLLIEEPESHLHAVMQRRLLAFFASTDKQYFVTTHSNVFLDSTFVERVFFTTYDGRVHISDATSRASILDDLGYSVADNLVSDLVILVEGPTDRPVIEEFLKQSGVYGRFNIKIWPLGGDIMAQLDLSILTQAYKLIALVDRDPGSEKVRRQFCANCEELGVPVHVLERYAIENYFTVEALRSVFGAQIRGDLAALSPHESVESQIGMNVKRNNRKIARAMKPSDIAGTDLQTFLDFVAKTLGA